MSARLPFRWRMRALGLFTRAHVMEFLREPGALFWAMGFPILLSWALGLAFLAPHQTRSTLVVSRTDSARVRAILPDTSSLALVALEGGDALRALRRGEAVGVVSVDDAGIRLEVDTTSQEGVLARLLVERSAGRAGSGGVRVSAPRAAAGGYADFLFPGMLALSLMNACVWGIGFALMDLRLRKMLRLFASTPLARTDILLSVVAARSIQIPIEAALLWGFGMFVFHVQLHGSVVVFCLVGVASVLAFAGMGILGASRVQQTQSAYGIVNALTIPMTIVSGVFFAWTRFPQWLHPIVGILPLTLSADALRAVSSEGAGWLQVWPRVAGLVLWGVVCGGTGLRIFRWR